MAGNSAKRVGVDVWEGELTNGFADREQSGQGEPVSLSQVTDDEVKEFCGKVGRFGFERRGRRRVSFGGNSEHALFISVRTIVSASLAFFGLYL